MSDSGHLTTDGAASPPRPPGASGSSGSPGSPGPDAPPPDLDLARTIRPGLDILANEIVIALKKRTRFAVNAPVYAPGLVIGRPDVSLLEHNLAGVERLHAQLGRYTYASQDAFSDVADVAPMIRRKDPVNAVRAMPSRVGARVLAFYRQWIRDTCRPGDESASYGETVTADVAALLSIMERVNLGKPVAESKFRELESRFRATGGEREAMLSLIVRPEREALVMDLAQRLGERYELDPMATRAVFEFMIGTTIDIEIDYLQRRLGAAAGPTGTA